MIARKGMINASAALRLIGSFFKADDFGTPRPPLDLGQSEDIRGAPDRLVKASA
jgi:hypothetical protein